MLKIKQVKDQAIRAKHWETIRDCDLYLAKVTQNENLFLKVYFATPYLVYRKRACALYGTNPNVEQKYLFTTQQKPNIQLVKTNLDIENGILNDQNLFDRKGRVLHRLLLTLAKDLYRPMRLATLHHDIFPEEHFNIEHSPNKVYQVIFRLREIFSQQTAGIEVEKIDHMYRLKIDATVGLILKNHYSQPRLIEDAIIETLSKLKNGSHMTSLDLSQTLGCTLRSAQRYLKQATTEGLLDKSSKNKKIEYTLANRKYPRSK